MNDRKQHVIDKAHQLFIEKGFQATSIQDILEHSGISKGTFYNYFPSKNDLLMAVFVSLNQRIDHDRNALIIGQDPSNIEIFIDQIQLQMEFNHKNNLFSLFEEVFVSNDPTLKQFLKRFQTMHLQWVYVRFKDLFDKTTHPYLLDCAIMFHGMLHHNIHYHVMANGVNNVNIKPVIQYTVERLVKMVEDVEKSGTQLLDPVVINKWLPDGNQSVLSIQQELNSTIQTVKKCFSEDKMEQKSMELLDFIHEELLHSNTPRIFLIQSAITSLRNDAGLKERAEVEKLEELVNQYLTIKKES